MPCSPGTQGWIYMNWELNWPQNLEYSTIPILVLCSGFMNCGEAAGDIFARKDVGVNMGKEELRDPNTKRMKGK